VASSTAAPPRIRVMFLIRQLGIGGAERQLLNLVSGLDPAAFEVHVSTMYDGGGLVPLFAAVPHVTLHSLTKQGRWDLYGFFSRLRALARQIRPDIVHGYMGGANELAMVAAQAVGAKCIWGIRVSDLAGGEYTWSVGALFRVGALLSRRVALQIANSERGREYHVNAGYRADNFIVIPNGIDIERFAPRPEKRAEWRAKHTIPNDRRMLLMPARLDPMKDHETFFQAIVRLRDSSDFVAVCLGGGPAHTLAAYEARTAALGIADRVRFLDATTNVADAYAAADVVVLSSAYGEGFPNVLGEAMACGRVCVATDVGDAGMVVADPTRIVAPGDAAGFAAALHRVFQFSPSEVTAIEIAARERIVSQFSIPSLVARTSDVLRKVAGGLQRN